MWYLLGHMFVIVISPIFHQGDVISLDSMGQWRTSSRCQPQGIPRPTRRDILIIVTGVMIIIMMIIMIIGHDDLLSLLLAFICLLALWWPAAEKYFYRFPCWLNPILDGKSYELTMATIRSRRQLARVADDQHLHGLRAIHKIPGQDSAWVYHPVFSQYLLISHWYLFSVSA